MFHGVHKYYQLSFTRHVIIIQVDSMMPGDWSYVLTDILWSLRSGLYIILKTDELGHLVPNKKVAGSTSLFFSEINAIRPVY